MSSNDGPFVFEPAALDDRAAFEQALQAAEARRAALPVDAPPVERARADLDIAEAQSGLGQQEAAWNLARAAFDVFVEHEAWQDAVEACEVMYRTEQPACLVALAHGVWLAVTYPIAPQTTVTMLNYIIEETPPQADGAAVAAAAAHYIAGVRADDHEFESLTFLTRNMLVRVAERHSNVNSQEALDAWMARLELNDPERFLKRLGMVVEAIAGGQWWIDRDALRARLPDQ